ncbi:MAG: beta-mannosidase [Cyclobacteriaceae bacterium]
MRARLLILFTLSTIWAYAQPALIDDEASKKTKNLYHFLNNVSSRQILFGHQDDFSYGVSWWDERGKSDVKEVTGKYPAVIGWDFGGLGDSRNLDSVSFLTIKKGVKYAYKLGAINTVSWHMKNPLTGDDAWSKVITVREILPGGSAHANYTSQLDLFAKTIRTFRSGLFGKIPIIFRPFHEHNGDWFWWSKEYCSEEEFIQLWRFTVDYLKNEKKLHNLIYAYSPDKSRFDIQELEKSYLYGYPGDEYVDVIGLDNYWDVGNKYNRNTDEEKKKQLTESILLISKIAKEKNKVAALTETGNPGLKQSNWCTEILLNPLKNAGEESSIAWMLLWRNADKGYFYVPYKGHDQEEDFKSFEQDDATLFLEDIVNPYK